MESIVEQNFGVQGNPLNLTRSFNSLSSLETNINSNFDNLTQVIMKQIDQMNQTKNLIKVLYRNQEVFFKKLGIHNDETPSRDQRQSKISLSLSEKSITCFGSNVRDPEVLQYKKQINENAFQKINLQKNSQSRDENIDLTLSKDFINNSSQGNVQVSYPSFGNIQIKQGKVQILQQTPKTNQLELVQKKILEMNQRLSALEVSEQKTFKTNFKRFRELNMQVQKYEEAVHKNTGTIKMFQLEVQKLRSELTEYKLKKESQLMKMSSSFHQAKGQSTQNNFIVDKIIFLSKNVTEMVRKTQFSEQISELNNQIQNIKKSLKKFIQSEQLQVSIQMLDRKIQMATKNKGKKLKNNQKAQENPQSQQNMQNKQKQEEEIEPTISQQFLQKIYSQGKLLNQLKNEIGDLAEQLSQHKNKSNHQFSSSAQRANEITSNLDKLQFSAKNHQDFLKEMNKTYNGKLFDNENQIIQMQQQIQKLSNQLKSYQHSSRPDANSTAVQPQNQVRNIDLQNDVVVLKRKVGKFDIKIQELREDLLKVRRDFATDVETIKAGVEKKADFESLKQGLGFFENHLKQLSGIVRDLSTAKPSQEKQQGSLATKKSWTCLCCDKQVKALGLQGKMTDVKFTSMFPSKFESPRIGGYYKQNQSERQYKALYFQKQRKLIKSGSKDMKEDQ